MLHIEQVLPPRYPCTGRIAVAKYKRNGPSELPPDQAPGRATPSAMMSFQMAST
jgi:hypothetical protein